MSNNTNNFENLIHKTLKLNLSKISLPPTLFLVVVLLALVLLLNVVSSFQKISQQSKALTCGADQCATSTGCQARGFRQNGYVCIGNNQWQGPGGDIATGGPEGPIVAPPVEVPAEEQPADELANYVPLNYEEELQRRAQERDASVTVVEQCNAIFWNIKPPLMSVEEAAAYANEALLDVQQRVENGEDFETACKNKAREMNADRPTYDQAKKDYYRGEYSIGMNFRLLYSTDEQPAYTPQNGSLNEEIKNMAVGELRMFDQIDGGYIDDDITENDEDYLAGYFLVRKVQ